MKDKNYSSCCFKRSTQKFFISAFESCHCWLFVGFSCTFSSYFSMSLKLHPDFSWLRRPTQLLLFLVVFFCQVFHFRCCCFCTAIATDFRGHFLPLTFFCSYSFPKFCACTALTCFYESFPGSRYSFKFTALPMWFETQAWPICLFESHSVPETNN